MTSRAEHYSDAERALTAAGAIVARGTLSLYEADQVRQILAAAQVHATLATVDADVEWRADRMTPEALR